MSNAPEIRTFDVAPRTKKLSHRLRRLRQTQQAASRLRASQQKDDTQEDVPAPELGKGGARGRNRLHGLRNAGVAGIPSTAHTAATAFPYVAGPSVGLHGPWIGDEVHGGGAFCIDPWELYRLGVISGMSALVFGTVGSGKSSLVKSWAMRLVLSGRKLAVPSDIKGEWPPVIEALGGAVIRVAPGLATRLNVLDSGVRPEFNAEGERMEDQEWFSIVRQRRVALLMSVISILRHGKELDEHENYALDDALDAAAQLATSEDRQPITPDVRRALEDIHRSTNPDLTDEMKKGADRLRLTLSRLEKGDLAGMFDGPSNVRLDRRLPAVGIDTSALRYASPLASRIVSACCGSWMEAMIAEDDAQRMVVYEEGWDQISNEADLTRMQTGWKLARHLGIFNVLILHKVDDLGTADAEGSSMAAKAEGLLADADIKVIYRQDNAALRKTNEKLELTDKENSILRKLKKGRGLWRVQNSTYEVENKLTEAEKPLLDTDQNMDKSQSREWMIATAA